MWILGISILAWIILVTGLLRPGPMDNLMIPCFLIGVSFLIWYLIVNDRLKRTLELKKDVNGSFFISIPEKKGGEISVNRVVVMEPFFGRVSYGKGPLVKEIYLKLYDENNVNSLTLAYRLGALNFAPEGFFELEENELWKTNKGAMIYDCAKFHDVFCTLAENRMIEIRNPLFGQ